MVRLKIFLFRPPDDSQEVLCFTHKLFWHPTSHLPDRQTKCGMEDLSHPSPNLWGQEIWPWFSTNHLWSTLVSTHASAVYTITQNDDSHPCLIFTALHVMQTRYCDENSVRLSVRPSVCHTRVLWQNGRKICPNLYTIRKNI